MNPIVELEQKVSDFFGSPYAVAVDCCTHGIELCLRVLDEGDAIYIPRGWWHYVESIEPSINVSIHYWRTVNFFRDLLIELLKVFLHDIGLYKKNNCSCHSLDKYGKRLKRG